MAAGSRSRRRRRRGIAACLAAVCLLALPATVASAADKEEELFTFGERGAGAGQFEFPADSAADPKTGHVFIGDDNNRVDEFTPWGKFVKAFGWDVAPGAVNELQEVRVRADGGSFRLCFEGECTADLAFNASAEEVQAALDSLASIGGVGGEVAVEARPGGAEGAIPFIFTIAFKGALAGTDVPQVEAENGTEPLGGGDPATELEARTLADGTPGGTGLETCTAESGCKAGSPGPGAGQTPSAGGVSFAVDLASDVYVGERANTNDRVQKFTPAGHFLWMAGGEVDKTEVKKREEQEENLEPVTVTEADENLCTAASGHECGKGTSGPGNGQFDFFNIVGLAPGGATLYVAGRERIQKLNTAGEYSGEVPDPGNIRAGKLIRRLAVGTQSGALYVAFSGKEDVYKLNPTTGGLTDTLQVEKPGALAAGPEGHLYVVNERKAARLEHIIEFDSEGNQVEPPKALEEECEAEEEGYKEICESLGIQPPEAPANTFKLRGLGAGPAGDLYAANVYPGGPAAFVTAYGPPPVGLEAPPPGPPEVLSQYAVSVGEDEAALRAQINPHFARDTRYYVQYGTGRCSEGGCPLTKPAPPGALLSDQIVDASLNTSQVFLEGLAPGVTYHYRFVAQSSGGGPVFGVGEGEEEGSFTTFRATGAPPACSNEALRPGPAALLPDCRAYEMVSPLDKEGADLSGYAGSEILTQASTAGQRLTYGSANAFGDAPSAPGVSQYLAARGEGGWRNRSLGAPLGRPLTNELIKFSPEFVAFSPDLCQGWLANFLEPEPPLDPAAPPGYQDLYRRSDDECGGPGYVAMNTATPPNHQPGAGLPGTDYLMELQGVSADGSEAVFLANDSLPGSGAPAQPTQCEEEHTACRALLYGRRGGDTRFLCVLPGGEAWGGFCTAGEKFEPKISTSKAANLTGALSEDGSRVFWTAGSGAGHIYLREDPFGPGAECSGGSSPCTIAVSKQAEEESKTSGSLFWLAAADGSRAIFTSGADLYQFEVQGESTVPIAGKALGVMGASKDAKRVYFASEEDLDEGGPAEEGKDNLYLYQSEAGGGGSYAFIAALSDEDLHGEDEVPSPLAANPHRRAARVSPDGLHAAFLSFASPTGYDNLDASAGRPDAELYLYDATANGGAGGLACATCNPSGARPHGRQLEGANNVKYGLAARIGGFETVLYASRLLSEDGRRLFFEGYDPLTPRDANGAADVYQWEAPGKGACAASSSTYSPANGGCLDLISSGQAPTDSELLDASPDGHDVFFTTSESLLPADYGLPDIYDAREGGGFPSPPSPSAPCEGEACQSPPAGPAHPTPPTAAPAGEGNLSERGNCQRLARQAKALSRRAKRLGRKARRASKPAKAKHLRRRSTRLSKRARGLSVRAKRCRAAAKKGKR